MEGRPGIWREGQGYGERARTGGKKEGEIGKGGIEGEKECTAHMWAAATGHMVSLILMINF